MNLKENKKIENLLSTIFYSKEITFSSDSRYLESMPYDFRRSIDKSEILSENPIGPLIHPLIVDFERICEADSRNNMLPTKLGPYEADILGNILTINEPIIIFRSGTGSGKSTLIRRLKHYCDELAVFLSTTQNYSINKFLDYIDLDEMAEEFGLGVDQKLNKEKLQNKSDILKSELCRGLISSMFAFCDIRFYEKETLRESGEDAYNTYQFVMGKTLSYIEGITIEDKKLNEISNSLKYMQLQMGKKAKKNIESCAKHSFFPNQLIKNLNPGDALFASVLIFAAMAKHLHEDVSGTMRDKIKFILVLDNTDSIHPNLFPMIKSLHRKMSKYSVGINHFSIVTFTRLSTSRMNIIGANKERAMHAHKSPLPAQVVLHSILVFFTHRKDDVLYNQLSLEEQFELNARLIALAIKLLDKKSHVFEILNSIAGTNIRNAYEQVEKWILDNHNRIDFMSIRRRPNRLFRREVIRLSRELGSSDFGFSLHHLRQQAIYAYVECTHSGVFQSSRMRGYINSTFGCYSASENFAQGKYLSEIQAKMILDVYKYVRKSEHGLLEGCEDESSADGYHRLFNTLVLSGLASHSEKKKLEYITNNRNELQSLRNDFEENEMGASAIDFIMFLHDYLITKYSDAGSRISVEYSTLENVAHTLTLRSGHPRFDIKTSTKDISILPNNYLTINALFEEDVRSTKKSFKACNLFTDENNDLSLSKLYLLYYVNDYQDRGVDTITFSRIKKNIVEDAEKIGISKGDINKAFGEMVKIDRRLIISGVADEYEAGNGFSLINSQELHPSWAGRAYYKSLLDSPYFVNWCLNEIVTTKLQFKRIKTLTTDVSLNNVLVFYDYYLHVFDELFKQELLCLASQANTLGHARLAVESVVADIFTRTLFPVIKILTATAPSTKDDTRSTELKWEFVKSAKKMNEDIYNLLRFDTQAKVDREIRITDAERNIDGREVY